MRRKRGKDDFSRKKEVTGKLDAECILAKGPGQDMSD